VLAWHGNNVTNQGDCDEGYLGEDCSRSVASNVFPVLVFLERWLCV